MAFRTHDDCDGEESPNNKKKLAQAKKVLAERLHMMGIDL